MTYYYTGGGTPQTTSTSKLFLAMFLGGFPDDTNFVNITDGGHITNKDPYWMMGGSAGGAQTIEIGLYNDYRIEIDQANGIRAWNGSGWVDLLSAGGAHTHDGETLQFDSVNSDGGAFAFDTTGIVTFNNEVIITTKLRINGINSYFEYSGDSMRLQYTADATHYPYIDWRDDGGNRGAYFGWGNGGTIFNMTFEQVSHVDWTGAELDMNSQTISGVATLSVATQINLPGGGYMNADEHYAETHIRIRNGHNFIGYSAGNDKYIQIYHNDVDTIFYGSSGAFHFMPSGDPSDFLMLYTAGNEIYLEVSGADNLFLKDNFLPQNGNTFNLGGFSFPWATIYYHTLSDRTCADFSQYSIEELYGLFSNWKKREDGVLHHDVNSSHYFPHIDFNTLPDEFTSVFIDSEKVKIEYDVPNIPRYDENNEIELITISYKTGDKDGINFNTMVYALKDLVVKQYEKILDLESRIIELENK